MWYNYYTIFYRHYYTIFKRKNWRAPSSNKGTNYSKQKWGQSLHMHTVNQTWFWIMNYLSCSLSPAGIKHTGWLKKSWVSTFSHRKTTFVPAAIQPCLGFTLERTSPCSLEAVLWFRKTMSSLCITEHCEPTDQMQDAFSGISNAVFINALSWGLPESFWTFVRL